MLSVINLRDTLPSKREVLHILPTTGFINRVHRINKMG